MTSITLQTQNGEVDVRPVAIDAVEQVGEGERRRGNLIVHLRGGSTINCIGNRAAILAQIPNDPEP